MHVPVRYVGSKNRKDASIIHWPLNNCIWSGVNKELCPRSEGQGGSLERGGYAAAASCIARTQAFMQKKQVTDTQ